MKYEKTEMDSFPQTFVPEFMIASLDFQPPARYFGKIRMLYLRPEILSIDRSLWQ
jgi:hypothetical protein